MADREPERERAGSFPKLRRFHAACSLLMWNTVLLFIAANVIVWAGMTLYQRLSPPRTAVAMKYGDKLLDVYPGMDRAKVDALLKETWSRPVRYEPYAHFMEQEHRGEHVNVHAAGFRHGGSSLPWPPEANALNIFVFGGSTTFGYGVGDRDTIPAQLGVLLAAQTTETVRVYNFGQAYYYSTQERVLFEQLVQKGFVPDVAVFIDGLNDFFYVRDEPRFSERFAESIGTETAPNSAWPRALGTLPLFQLASKLASGGKPPRRMTENADDLTQLAWQGDAFAPAGERENPNQRLAADEEFFNNPEIVARVIGRYQANKSLAEASARHASVRTVFVWQPIPGYKYDLEHHPFGGGALRSYGVYGYPEIRKLHDKNELGNNFVWAADIQETASKSLYVDAVHYSPEMCGMIAETIAPALIRAE